MKKPLKYFLRFILAIFLLLFLVVGAFFYSAVLPEMNLFPSKHNEMYKDALLEKIGDREKASVKLLDIGPAEAEYICIVIAYTHPSRTMYTELGLHPVSVKPINDYNLESYWGVAYVKGDAALYYQLYVGDFSHPRVGSYGCYEAKTTTLHTSKSPSEYNSIKITGKKVNKNGK